MQIEDRAILSTLTTYIRSFEIDQFTAQLTLESDPKATIIITNLDDIIYNSIYIKNPIAPEMLIEELKIFQHRLSKPLTVWTTSETHDPELNKTLKKYFYTPGDFHCMLLDLEQTNIVQVKKDIIIMPVDSKKYARDFAKLFCHLFDSPDIVNEVEAWAIRQYLTSGNNCINYLAIMNGTLAGVSTLVIDDNFKDFNTGGFYNACVLPEFRRMGIATAMARYRIEMAKNIGLRYISVILMSDAMAKGYCEQLGFKNYQHITPYYLKDPV